MRVLLHGFTGAPSSWDPLRPALEPALALALPGHAGAPAQPDWDHAVDALVAQLPPEPVHLVGYSLGGRLALGIAARRPGRLRRLTLIGAHPGLTDPQARAERRHADDQLADRLERDGLETFVRHWEALPLWATQARLPEAARAAIRATRLAQDPAGLAASLRGQGLGVMPDLGPALAGITVPVDVVVGEEDQRFRPIAAALADRLPHARLHVVADVGHAVQVEAPDAITRILVDLP